MARRRRGNFLAKQSNTRGTSRARRIALGFAIAFGFIVLMVGVSYLCLLGWLQGDDFRERIGNFMQKLTHAEQVAIPENLQIDGGKLTLPQFTLRKTKFFEELSIGKLHVGLDRLALLKRILRMNQFSAEELRLIIRTDHREHNEPGAPNIDKKPTPSAPGQTGTRKANSSPAYGSHPFFKNVQAHSFEAHYTDTSIIHENREYGLTGYRLVATPYPKGGKDAWTLNIENGRVVSPFSWLRESGVKTATVRWVGDEVRLTSCRILLSPGNISAKAHYKLSTGQWKARIDVQRAGVERILKPDWRKKLTGVLVGHIDFAGQAQQEWGANGELRMEDGIIEGLPLLSELKLHGTTPYRTLQIEKASCKLSFPYTDAQHNIHNAWLWDNIELRTRGGSLIVHGRVITGQDGSLSGTLRIGVPQQLLAELGLEQTPLTAQLFNAPIELPGYVWLHMNLSGTFDDPHEDLSVRLSTILQQSISSIPGAAVQSMQKVLHNFIPSTKVPTPATQQDDTKEPHHSTPAVPLPEKSVEKAGELIQKGLNLFL